jgi:hypothetical protein
VLSGDASAVKATNELEYTPAKSIHAARSKEPTDVVEGGTHWSRQPDGSARFVPELSNDLGTTEHKIRVVDRKGFHHATEPPRENQVVTVEKGNKPPTCQFHTTVASCGCSLVVLSKIPYPRVLDGPYQVRRIIHGAVIHDYHFERAEALRQDRADRTEQALSPIVGRDDDRYNGWTVRSDHLRHPE